jgi:hypothetical protein
MRAEDEMNEERDTDERLWHPWLRINRVLPVMLHTPEPGAMVRGHGRVSQGRRDAERDPACGMV